MTFERGTPGNTLSTFPTRQFTFVLDPGCLTALEDPYTGVLELIADLRRADPPVWIFLIYPAYLAPTAERRPTGLEEILTAVREPPATPSFILDSAIPAAIHDRLLDGTEQSSIALNLLALADALQADGVVTGSARLTQARYVLRQHHRIRIVPLEESADVLEVCAHGHSIFWSATNADRRLDFDAFYILSHWKAKRLFEWFSVVQAGLPDDDLREYLRSALLNRYPFLLYSRDIVRFYELQQDYYSRRGLLQRFGLGIGYHATAFYLLLWGMLDHLTVIAKYARNLTVGERDCGIRSRAFWQEFEPKEPGLAKFVFNGRIAQWITVMADMRHAAAHRTVTMPAPMLMHTAESKKSDEEILEIVRKEKALFYTTLPAEMIKALEPQFIWHWRISKMKTVAPSMVLIKGQSSEYFRDPVVSIDYDLAMLTAVLDAFLVALFRHTVV